MGNSSTKCVQSDYYFLTQNSQYLDYSTEDTLIFTRTVHIFTISFTEY